MSIATIMIMFSIWKEIFEMKINGKKYNLDSWNNDSAWITDLVGKTFTQVIRSDDEAIVFVGEEEVYAFYHRQDCCESVSIEDVCGDLSDLENLPLLVAREDSNQGELDYGSFTWTFYNFSTNRGSVTIRWYGTSNGYYSESVGLYRLEPESKN